MSYKLSLHEFKSKHGLSNQDMHSIVEKDYKYDVANPVYDESDIALCNKIDVVVDRMKLNNGIFTDTDAQHAAHVIETLNKEIKALKERLNKPVLIGVDMGKESKIYDSTKKEIDAKAKAKKKLIGKAKG